MRPTPWVPNLAVAIVLLTAGLTMATFSPEKYVHHVDVADEDEAVSDPIAFEELSPNAKAAFLGALEASQGGRTDQKYVVTGG